MSETTSVQTPDQADDSPQGRQTFGSDFRRSMFAGLGALLPAVLTIFILVSVFSYVVAPVHFVVGKVLDLVDPLLTGESLAEQYKQSKWAYAFDLIIAVLGVYVLGRFLVLPVGQRIFRLLDSYFARIPLIKSLYPQIRQLADFLFTKRQFEFKHVVAVPYPRKGIYAIGFVTGETVPEVGRATGQEMVNVFMPSSPTPFTGYMVMVPRKDVVDLDMTIEEAFRLVVSGGVLVPNGGGNGLSSARSVDADAEQETPGS